jgi:hypothetical protein
MLFNYTVSIIFPVQLIQYGNVLYFQGILLFLQNLPTHNWTNEEIGLLLAEAYKLKYMFADAPNHLTTKSS